MLLFHHADYWVGLISCNNNNWLITGVSDWLAKFSVSMKSNFVSQCQLSAVMQRLPKFFSNDELLGDFLLTPVCPIEKVYRWINFIYCCATQNHSSAPISGTNALRPSLAPVHTLWHRCTRLSSPLTYAIMSHWGCIWNGTGDFTITLFLCRNSVGQPVPRRMGWGQPGLGKDTVSHLHTYTSDIHRRSLCLSFTGWWTSQTHGYNSHKCATSNAVSLTPVHTRDGDDPSPLPRAGVCP